MDEPHLAPFVAIVDDEEPVRIALGRLLGAMTPAYASPEMAEESADPDRVKSELASGTRATVGATKCP